MMIIITKLLFAPWLCTNVSLRAIMKTIKKYKETKHLLLWRKQQAVKQLCITYLQVVSGCKPSIKQVRSFPTVIGCLSPKSMLQPRISDPWSQGSSQLIARHVEGEQCGLSTSSSLSPRRQVTTAGTEAGVIHATTSLKGPAPATFTACKFKADHVFMAESIPVSRFH